MAEQSPNAQLNTGAAGTGTTGAAATGQQPAGQANEATLLETGVQTPPAEGAKKDPPAAGEAKPGEEKPGEEKPGEKKPDEKGKAEGAPEKYGDFTAPEGVTLDTEIVGKFTGLAKEFNLTQDGAQKFVDLAAEHQGRILQQQMDKWNEISAEWQTKLKADKEFGGDKFSETVQRAKRALDKFGAQDEDLMTVIKPIAKGGMGLGNNPGVIRLLARFDKATSEDAFVDGDTSGKDNRPAADILYPNQGKK